MKSLALLPLLAFMPLMSAPVNPEANNNVTFNLTSKGESTYKITGVREESIFENELRVYNSEEYHVDEIESGSFDTCVRLKSFMLSDCVVTIGRNTFTTVSGFEVINYTGSEADFRLLNLDTTNITVNYYACDEGFMNYWYTYVRQDETSNICNITKDQYRTLCTLYQNLYEEDLARVDAISDGEGTIKDSMYFLDNMFNEGDITPTTKEASKTMMIILILTIATLGMTFICVFYILKERNIIK